jgi:uncharacterized membrane protein
MSVATANKTHLESVLAGLLLYGTWVASIVTAVGIVLALTAVRSAGNPLGMRLVTAGCVCFILLPVLRVLTMLIAYLREHDYRFVAITATVLAIILAGFVVGMHLAKAQPR